jgi:hypothetical protein
MLYGEVTGFNPETKRPEAKLEGRYHVELDMWGRKGEPPKPGTLIWVTDMDDDEQGYRVADGWWETTEEGIRAMFEPVKVSWWDRLKFRLGFC